MEIKHRHSGTYGSFIIEVNGNREAELDYSTHNANEMVIKHTEVSEELRGKNIGFQLVQKAVEYARAHHIKIVPVCSFAKSVFEEVPDFGDVLASSFS